MPFDPSDQLSTFYDALDRFNGSVSQLKMQRTLSQANQAVDQIRNSELDSDQKMSQLRGIAQDMTFQLAAQGVPATTLQALTNYIPKPVTDFQTPQQAILSGDPDQRQRGQDLLGQEYQQQKDVANLHYQALKDIANMRVDAAGQKAQVQQGSQLDKRFTDFGKFLQDDEKMRNAYSQNSLTITNANRLRGLIGTDLSDDHLNKIAPQFVTEAAAGLARQVLGNQVQHEFVKELIPKDIKMDQANLEQYFTSQMKGANAAPFLRQYYQASNREAAVAQQQIEKSALARSQSYADLFKKDPQRAQAIMAAHFDGSKPEDFTLDAKGRVRYAPELRQENFIDTMVKTVGQLQTMSKSSDLATRANALATLKYLQIDPNTPATQLRQDIDFRTRSGGFDNLLYSQGR